ncbi:MAG: type II secretion system secretin GspD [Caulobacteraceae bacterium]|nr:type II secretion system secretin GspD [Caulobacteraceae bacterium]
MAQAAVAIALTIVAPVPAMAARGDQAHSQSYTFAFRDADISQVAQAILSDALGLSYTVDPSITGKMSFRIDRRMTDAQLLDAFQAALASSDIVLVRQGETVALLPRAKAKGAGPLRTASEGVHGAGYQTVTVPLAYAAPSEVAHALQAVTTNDPVVYVDDKQGLLILGGEGAELEAAVELVHTFDHSGLEGSKIRFFQLDQAPADTLASDLDHVLQASGVFGVTTVPLKRMNGLFVFARTSQAIDEVSRWVGKLDVAPKETSNGLWTYHPRSAAAENLASTLGNLLGSDDQQSGASETRTTSTAQTQSVTTTLQSQGGLSGTGGLGSQGSQGLGSASSGLAPSGPAGSGVSRAISGQIGDDKIRITADRDTNTLIILAPPSRWLQINKMLQEIDHSPDQVLIEASILEVTLTDQFNFGIDWSLVGAGGLTASSINSSSGQVAASTPGLSITFVNKSISAAINALQDKTGVEVLSEPKIITLDNKVAKLTVGDQVPIVTQSSVSTTTSNAAVVNSVEYASTGVILNVTPRITGDDKVFLDIDQQVSSVSQTTTSTIDSPTIQQRDFGTQLLLADGAVVALGGLISNEKDTADTGTPFIQSVPVLGDLFKTTTRKTTRSELIVLISAKIIRDSAASQQALTNMLADMKEIERRGMLKPSR